MLIQIHTYIHTYIHTHIHTYIHDHFRAGYGMDTTDERMHDGTMVKLHAQELAKERHAQESDNDIERRMQAPSA